jgi:uncharacterized membrane protein
MTLRITSPQNDQHELNASSLGLETTTLGLHMIANRSSIPRQESVVLFGIGVVLAVMSLRFLILGAWPIAIYSIIDVAVLAWAFRSFRRSRPTEEWLAIDLSGFL